MTTPRSESSPSVGDTVSTAAASTSTGKAPRLSTRASERASPSVKLPVIDTSPVNDGCVDLGRRLDRRRRARSPAGRLGHGVERR